MLSNETKLKRINEKLKEYGLELQFSCFDLKTYTPKLYKVQEEPLLFSVYQLYGVQLGVKVVGNNKVKFYVITINGVDGHKQTGNWFELYVNWVKNIDSVINYCNNLSLEVPKYTDF